MFDAKLVTMVDGRIRESPHFALDPRRLDYVLTRGLRVASADVEVLGDADEGYASDHGVVWADIDLTTSPRA